jgi:dynein heavy chain
LPVKKAEWYVVKDLRVISASYEESVKMMSEMNFLSNLLNFPKDQINDETVELLEVGKNVH